MARNLLLIFAVVAGVALLGSCREGSTYEYDLIKIQSQKKENEGIWASISPESKKRYMGAVIINGPPFSLSVALDHAFYDPKKVQIKSILIQRNGSSETLLYLPTEQSIQGSWVNHGAFSSWEPNAIFSFEIVKQEDICIKLILSDKSQDQFEIDECFSLTRVKGKAKMRVRDILNQ